MSSSRVLCIAAMAFTIATEMTGTARAASVTFYTDSLFRSSAWVGDQSLDRKTIRLEADTDHWSGTQTVHNGDVSGVVTWDLGQQGLDLDWWFETPGYDTFIGTLVDIHFSVDEDTTYTYSGYYGFSTNEVIEPTGIQTIFIDTLDSAGGRSFYAARVAEDLEPVSVPEDLAVTGSPSGVLVAGRSYAWDPEFGIDPTRDSAYPVHSEGHLSLRLGDGAAAPLPAVAWSGLGLIGGVFAWQIRRIRR